METNVVASVTVVWLLCSAVFRVGSGLTFKNAMAFCRKHQHEMLADRDGSERTLLKNYMVSKNWDEVWLAITGTKFENYQWLDGHQNAFGDIQLDGNNCGYLSTQSKYLDRKSCANTSPGYLCQDKATRCAARHNCIEAFGRAFVYSCNGLGWYQARTTCLERGMDLAVIHEPAVQREIFQNSEWMNCDAIWVGLRRESWFYLTSNGRRDKEIMNPKWEMSEPSGDGNCVVLHRNGKNFKWKVVSCTSSHNTVCFPPEASQRKTEEIIVVAVMTSSFLVLPVTYCVCIYIFQKIKNRIKNEEQAFLTEEPDIAVDQIALPLYDTNTDWYADSKGGRYSAEYNIDLIIPSGAVPEGQTYRIFPSISTDIFSCQAVTGQENHRVICPVVKFECLEDFLKPVTIRLPISVAKQQLLREARVLFQETGTTNWVPISTPYTGYTVGGQESERNVSHVSDQNADEDDSIRDLSITYEITIMTLNLHTKRLGKFMCSMPAPSLEDTSLSAMLFAHVTEYVSDKIVQEVVLQAVVLDNMYNLPCFKQTIYDEYGGKPVTENILITLPADRHTENRRILEVDLGTRDEEGWTVFGCSSSLEKTEISLSELHNGLQKECGIKVCEIHLQNKENLVNSVMVTASFSVGQQDSENGQSYHKAPVITNFRVSLRPSEEDQLLGDSGCASSTKGSSFGSGRDVISPTTYNKPSDLPSTNIYWCTLI